MVEAVQKFGRPFMQEHFELSTLYEAMRHSRLGGPNDQYRIPAVCVLLGKNAEAETFLEEKLKEIGSRNDIDAEWFRTFAANSVRLLSPQNDYRYWP